MKCTESGRAEGSETDQQGGLGGQRAIKNPKTKVKQRPKNSVEAIKPRAPRENNTKSGKKGERSKYQKTNAILWKRNISS